MIYIKKGREPFSLTEYKKDPYAYYDGCDKDAIRDSLLREQGWLCAYCMRRIEKRRMKIEHWYPEEKLSERQKLDYKNMLGVCEGHIEGHKGREDTCDAQKGNRMIKVNPCDERTLAGIGYKSKTGEIYSEDGLIMTDLDETLNLNSQLHCLPVNRKAKLNAVIGELVRINPNGTWTKARLQAFMEKYSAVDEEGKKREYLGIVIWYLRKKIRGKP